MGSVDWNIKPGAIEGWKEHVTPCIGSVDWNYVEARIFKQRRKSLPVLGVSIEISIRIARSPKWTVVSILISNNIDNITSDAVDGMHNFLYVNLDTKNI